LKPDFLESERESESQFVILLFFRLLHSLFAFDIMCLVIFGAVWKEF